MIGEIQLIYLLVYAVTTELTPYCGERITDLLSGLFGGMPNGYPAAWTGGSRVMVGARGRGMPPPTELQLHHGTRRCRPAAAAIAPTERGGGCVEALRAVPRAHASLFLRTLELSFCVLLVRLELGSEFLLPSLRAELHCHLIIPLVDAPDEVLEPGEEVEV